MRQPRLVRGGAAVGLLRFAALTMLGAAQFPGKGKKLPEAIKLEADIPYAGTANPRQRLNLLLPKTPKLAVMCGALAALHPRAGALRGRLYGAYAQSSGSGNASVAVVPA